MINVLIGPANSGKMETLLARVADAISAKQRGTHLIVPTFPAASLFRELLAEKVAHLPTDAVKTFPALYYTIFDKTNTVRERMNAIQRDRVLRFVIAELAEAGQLSYFGETAGMPGLINALGSFIEELWRSHASPKMFARIAATRGDKDRDIARVFTRYAEALESLKAADAESAGPAALSAFEQASEPHRWLSLVAVEGFDFLTTLQVHLLTALAARGVEILVSLTYDEARAIHYWQRPTVARLRGARANFIPYETKPHNVIQVAAAALMTEQEVAASFDGNTVENQSSSGEIVIVSAPDRATEVRSIAREIKRLAVEQAISLDEVAIVCRSLSQYANHLERVFDECAIPLTIDTRLAVMENPAVTALLRLFGLSHQSFSRRSVLQALSSPYFNWSEFGLDEKAINLLDTISLAGNVIKGREQWRQAIKAFADKPELERMFAEHEPPKSQSEEERSAAYIQLSANLDRCFDALTPLVRATPIAHLAWVSHLMERLHVDEQLTIGDTAQRDVSALKEFRSILSAVAQDKFTQTLASDADESAHIVVSRQTFIAELERMLSVVTHDRNPVTRSSVMAQEAHRMRQRHYRAIFILGMIEGEFPARMTEQAPYTFAERESLRQAGLDLTETINDVGADLLQFYKAISRADERLYLSYSRTDVAGGELLPSYLIEDIQPFVTSPVNRIAPALSHEDNQMARACSLDELAMQISQSQRRAKESSDPAHNLESLKVSHLLDSMLPSWPMTQRGMQAEWRRLTGARPNINNGWMVDPQLVEDLRLRFGQEYMWSASQINDYGTCPFRFFAKYALKLDVADEPGEGLAAHQLGHAYHRILEHLYTELHKRKETIQPENAEQAIAEAAQTADAVLKQMIDDGEARADGLWELGKSEIKRRIARLLRQEAEWNDAEPAHPILCECKFGMGGVAPLIVEWENSAAKFRGIVDRIDQRGDGEWIVVDYKTRRTPIHIKDALEGRNLQLPIYAMAASRVISQQASVTSAYYLHIHSRKRGSELTKKHDDATKNLENLIQHTEERIRRYVEQIRSGSFPVHPNGDMVCQTCSYGVMCRIQSLRASEDEQDRND